MEVQIPGVDKGLAALGHPAGQGCAIVDDVRIIHSNTIELCGLVLCTLGVEGLDRGAGVFEDGVVNPQLRGLAADANVLVDATAEGAGAVAVEGGVVDQQIPRILNTHHVFGASAVVE
jgi:hypothetical protein